MIPTSEANRDKQTLRSVLSPATERGGGPEVIKMKGQKNLTHRVITMLERKEMDFLDKLGKDALFSTGRKLPYNEILKGLVDLAMEVGISGEKIASSDTFKQRLLEQIRAIMQEEEAKKG